MIDYKQNLSDEQFVICNSDKNLLVKACPGSGKTRTIIYKFAYRIEKNPDKMKKLVAITYTNRAADEIRERMEALGVDIERVWTGTIHQFCLEWILKRYKMYTKSLNYGFKIIDERVKERYLTELLNIFGNTTYWQDINTSYDREFHLLEKDEELRKIIVCYHQKLKENVELDFNLILVTAYNILKNNSFIANDIKNCIELICVDEYQDTQDLQYAIIEEIANSNLQKGFQVNFFGDPNQAIYRSLGGVAKDIETINQEFVIGNFEETTLSGCYRSTSRIIDFYREFMVSRYPIQGKGINKNEHGVIKYNYDVNYSDIYENIAQIIEENIIFGVPENEICVVAPVWDLLYPFSKELQERLPNVKFDAPDITPIKRDPLNVFYKITRLLLTEPNIKKFAYRKKLAREILDELEMYIGTKGAIDELNFLDIVIKSKSRVEKGSEFVKRGIDNILSEMKCDLNNAKELEKKYLDFFEKISNRLANRNYKLTDDVHTFKKMFREKEGVVINTCHGVKGEEYEVVIAFGLVYGKLPSIHILPMNRNEEAKKLLYVIASRAKSRLYLFSEKGRVYWNRDIREKVDAFPTPQLFQNTKVEYDN